MSYDHEATLNTMMDALRQFAIVSVLVSDADVEEARRAISMADSFGHILDPTKYRAALFSGRLQRQRDVVDLFARTVAELQCIFPDVCAIRRAGVE